MDDSDHISPLIKVDITKLASLHGNQAHNSRHVIRLESEAVRSIRKVARVNCNRIVVFLVK